MKIICLIRSKPPTVYMVNKIHADYPVSLVVIEQPFLPSSESTHSFFARLQQRARLDGLSGLTHSMHERVKNILRKIIFASSRKQIERMYDNVYGADWRQINPDVPVMIVKNINDEAVAHRLSTERPDVLIDHGTSIVKPHILEYAPLALNIHWGLSPYYRGTHCTDWALLNNDPYNIGVTVHRLTQDIDGGSIFGQKRIIPTALDTVPSINAKLTKAGTEIISIALAKLSQNIPLEFHRQDLSIGLLTYSRQYTDEIKNKIKKLEGQSLEKILQNPQRPEQPIVEA